VNATLEGVADVTMIGGKDLGIVLEVVLGVDTHLDPHVVVALDQLGRRLGTLTVPTTTEGTSSYGAGLARYLKAAGIAVMEVERPKRRHLRRNGKSDPIDAERAARSVLADETAGVPKSADGRVEMIRVLRAARRSAVKARSQAANQLQGLRVTAPDELRHRLRGLSTKELVAAAARLRPGNDPDDILASSSRSPGGGSGSHVLVGVHHGCVDVAQQ
jgi:transposase